MVARHRQGSGNILQIMAWVPAIGTTKRTRTNKVNHSSSGTVDRRWRRPTWSTILVSVGQFRPYIQSARLANDNEV